VSEFECASVCVCVCVGMEQKPGNASNCVKLTPKDTASLQGHTFTHAHTHTHTHTHRETTNCCSPLFERKQK